MSEHVGVYNGLVFFSPYQFLNRKNIIQFAGKLGFVEKRAHSKAVSTSTSVNLSYTQQCMCCCGNLSYMDCLSCGAQSLHYLCGHLT